MKKLALDALKETQRLLPQDSPEQLKVNSQITELEQLIKTNKSVPKHKRLPLHKNTKES